MFWKGKLHRDKANKAWPVIRLEDPSSKTDPRWCGGVITPVI